jgi:hypothetical protein
MQTPNQRPEGETPSSRKIDPASLATFTDGPHAGLVIAGVLRYPNQLSVGDVVQCSIAPTGFAVVTIAEGMDSEFRIAFDRAAFGVCIGEWHVFGCRLKDNRIEWDSYFWVLPEGVAREVEI